MAGLGQQSHEMTLPCCSHQHYMKKVTALVGLGLFGGLAEQKWGTVGLHTPQSTEKKGTCGET